MKISTKGLYGLKALVDLAINSTEEVVTLKSICERQGISERYLEQIFSLLRKNGIVKGRKGSQGGYVLSVNPEKITLGDILKDLEGELTCLVQNEDVDLLDKTMRHFIWDKVDTEVLSLLNAMTLSTLVEQYHKNKSQDYMYFI